MNNGVASSDFKRSNGPAKRKKSRDLFIPAFFIEPPNLDLYSALQNLMWYAVECLNALPSISGRNGQMTDHFFKSVSLLSAREKECASSLDPQSNKLFIRFLEEARLAEGLIRGFLDADAAKSADCPDIDLIPKSAAAAIAAKATYLQWILICLSAELRIPLSPMPPDAPRP
jgi:hypothetical protein